MLNNAENWMGMLDFRLVCVVKWKDVLREGCSAENSEDAGL